MSWMWCDGSWRVRESVPLDWNDRGWTHGLGLFETMLAVEGRPVFARRHLERLSASCTWHGWSVDPSPAAAAMAELLARNGLHEGRARIRLAVSGGSGNLRSVRSARDPRMWMVADRLEPPADTMRVGVSRWKRNAFSPLAGHKATSYAENLWILQEAADQGWDDALLFNQDDRLCEAATANVFLVRDGSLLTPPLGSGCLPGITRAVVIGLALRHCIPIREDDLGPEDLGLADEIFLTSSTRGVVAVSHLGDRTLPPGPLTARLKAYWIKAVEEQAGLGMPAADF